MKNFLKTKSLVILVLASVFLQGFSVIGIAAVAVILFFSVFAVAFVRSSKKQQAIMQDDPMDKLKESISKTRRVIFKSENDINKLLTWSNQAIAEALPDATYKYSTDELTEKFDQIKQEFNEKLDQGQWQKLTEIVDGYKAQIEIKKSEKAAAEKLKEKYEKLHEQLKKALAKEKNNQKLDKHQDRLEALSENTESLETIQEQTYILEDVMNEVEQKIIYIEQLQKLQEEYDDPNINTDSQAYRDELNRIMQELD